MGSLPHSRDSLFWRVYRYGLMTVGGAVLVLLVGFFHEQTRTTVSLIEREDLERFSELFDNVPILERALNDYGEQHVVRASVYSWDGKLVASTKANPSAPLLDSDLERLRTGKQSALVTYAAPLSRGEESIGYLLVEPKAAGTRLGELSRSLAVSRWVVLLLIVLAVVAIGTLPVARLMTAPLEKLTIAAKSLGAGDLSVRTGIRRRDEVGQLAEAFDQMAEHLQRQIREEKELLANVSHELRTPIHRLQLALELATEGDAERARRHLLNMEKDLKELEQLVEDVLITARLERHAGPRGSFKLDLKGVPCSKILDESMARFRAAHPDAKLEADITPELPEIQADSVLLRRVVDNLLDNAHKYSEAADPIVLHARVEGDEVRIEVRDRGIGISAEDLRRVFTPFFRTDRSRARGTGGVGLGLTLARGVAEAHGGKLVLESMFGLGTVARLTIPIRSRGYGLKVS